MNCSDRYHNGFAPPGAFVIPGKAKNPPNKDKWTAQNSYIPPEISSAL